MLIAGPEVVLLEEHFGALLVDRRLGAYAGEVFEVVQREIDAVLEPVR